MTRHRATYRYDNDNGDTIEIVAAVPVGGRAELECNCELIRAVGTAWVDYKLLTMEVVK